VQFCQLNAVITCKIRSWKLVCRRMGSPCSILNTETRMGGEGFDLKERMKNKGRYLRGEKGGTAVSNLTKDPINPGFGGRHNNG